MHPDPVTWSTRERAARYREQAAQFLKMANAAEFSSARDRLLELARHYDELAETLERRPATQREPRSYGTASSG
jgi:hypothetical protein